MGNESLRLVQDGLLAAPTDGAAFVDCDGAEVALAVTATVGGDRETDGLERLDLALRFIIRVLGALEIESVYSIQFGLGLVGTWRVLDQEPVSMFLVKSAPADRIVVLVEGVEHLDESQLISRDCFIGRQFKIAVALLFGDITQAANLMGVLSVTQGSGKFQGGFFGHPIQDVISLRVEQDGAPDCVIPEIVVGHTA